MPMCSIIEQRHDSTLTGLVVGLGERNGPIFSHPAYCKLFEDIYRQLESLENIAQEE